ncbi:MAG TPA: imidazole glycerol phosphate synthase subunit HisH [Chitinophagaceae bacterium]|nr:imidazole glycerol phosphate synthase subunit HisH [Chitinophagaceae bacterium]
MKIIVIKYNAGNIQSVLYALERLGINAEVTDDAEEIRSADKVIFPGVGEASSAMQHLRDRQLDAVIKDLKQPVFGICVGMQLLCEFSEENNTACIGVFPVKVKKFAPEFSDNAGRGELRKVPQMGWNTIYNLKTDLFTGVAEKTYIYNVHSYYAEDSSYTIAHCDYGVEYAAALRKDNFYGVQFHTEKSAEAGEQILRNFVEKVN